MYRLKHTTGMLIAMQQAEKNKKGGKEDNADSNPAHAQQHGNSMSSTRPGSSGARTKLVKEITNLAKDRISPPPSPALLDDDIPEESDPDREDSGEGEGSQSGDVQSSPPRQVRMYDDLPCCGVFGDHNDTDKLGDKMNMATVIVALTNACLNAESMIKKMHGHNFELRGKVADLSTAAIKKLAAEMDRNKSEIMKEIGDTVKENVDLDKSTQRSFADILGTNKEALVLPMKQAIKEIEKEDDRKKNVVITGLDLNPAVTDRKQQEEQVKTLATETVNEALRGGPGEVKELVVMGKMSGNSGKAPPVLVTLTNSEEARNVIKGASRLSRVQGLRNVYISPDLNKEERTRRKVLAEDLKKKIADFPEQYWYIRHGTVSSKGKYVPRNQSNSKIMDDDKEMDKSFNY
ncbi:hypothetical protein ACHWQZ_G012537 [Mnemiopsis leidyi]